MVVVHLNMFDGRTRPFLEQFSVRNTPTFILLDDKGDEIWRQVGDIDADAARRQVAALQE